MTQYSTVLYVYSRLSVLRTVSCCGPSLIESYTVLSTSTVNDMVKSICIKGKSKIKSCVLFCTCFYLMFVLSFVCTCTAFIQCMKAVHKNVIIMCFGSYSL